MSDYYLKYLKYKQKYLTLKKQFGGIYGITNENFEHTCSIPGYTQNICECWNDAIQTIISFSYPFEITQRIALISNEKTDSDQSDNGQSDSEQSDSDRSDSDKSDDDKNALIKSINNIINSAFKHRAHLIPIHLITGEDINRFKMLMEKYFEMMITRFRGLYKEHKKIGKAKKMRTMSTLCAINALDISRINNQNNLKYNKISHYGEIQHEIILLNSLSFILLKDNNFLNFDIYSNSYNFYKPLNKLKIDNINKKYFSLILHTETHVFCVYSCPNNVLYFHDNENTNAYLYDWINFFNKNIIYYDNDNTAHNLFIQYKKSWKFCLMNSYDDTYFSSHESRLCYYNEYTNQIIVYIPEINKYKLFEYVDAFYHKNSHLKKNSGYLVCFSCNEITDIIGLFIDNAETNSDYKNKLNLYDFLYLNLYNLEFVKKNIAKKINISNIFDKYYFVQASFMLSHNEIINKLYLPTSIEKYNLINSQNNDPHYFCFAKFFININQYHEFCNYFNVNNKFIAKVIGKNIYIGKDVLIYYTTQIEEKIGKKTINKINGYLSKQLFKIILMAVQNKNINLIIYMIENNTYNCLNRPFRINYDNNVLNNVSLVYYLFDASYYSYSSTLAEIINYFGKNWKQIYKPLFESTYTGDSVLYYVVKIYDKYNFKSIIKILYKLQVNGKIDIFNKLNDNRENFLFYNVQNLTKESINTMIEIIHNLNIDLKIINNSGKNIIDTHYDFLIKTKLKNTKQIIKYYIDYLTLLK